MSERLFIPPAHGATTVPPATAYRPITPDDHAFWHGDGTAGIPAPPGFDPDRFTPTITTDGTADD